MSSPPAQVKPRAAAFLIPIGIALLGLAIMVFLIVRGVGRVDDVVDDFDRVSVGESATFDLEEGGYRVWLEGDGVDSSFESVEYTIVSADDGEPVITSSFSSELTYNSDGRTGTAIETFDLDEPGTYQVEFTSTSSNRDDRSLAIGQDNPLGVAAASIVFGVLAAGLAIIVALVITIILFVRRSRSRRAAQGPPRPPASGYAYGYPPQGYPPPPGYPPQGYPPQGPPPPG
jgi:hypothetical protein